jgi:H+/Cl- antiporter ClcA
MLQSAVNFLGLIMKWVLLCILVGVLAGASSALFLYTLNWATTFRDGHLWLIFLLPIAGLVIGLLYHYYGKEVVKGNNLILEEYERPRNIIPLKMAPLVYAGTLLTHFFGGSAGREGTAVQMSTAIADQFTGMFKLTKQERKIILIIGISGGFSSVFGTPLTGAIFAIEVLYFSRISFKSILPSFLTAYIAFYTVELLHIPHTHYPKPYFPEIHLNIIPWLVFAGIVFGLTARIFSTTVHFIQLNVKSLITYPPLRPFYGGLIFAAVIYFSGATQYLGLGIPTILESFKYAQDGEVFLLKLIATAFILGTGFKGGEVTPLFFIGAALGSALSLIVPLPVSLLAAMGFVAVFSGATHTPLACTVMGIELFGLESGVYVGIACIVAYFFSGYLGIYESQVVKGPKHFVYHFLTRRNLKNL